MIKFRLGFLWGLLLMVVWLAGCKAKPELLALQNTALATHTPILKSPELLPATTATISATPTYDQLHFRIQWPEHFKTSVFEPSQIVYLRMWVKGPGIRDRIWNDDGYVAIQNQTGTLHIASVTRGVNRVITAQAYNDQKQPIANLLLKAIYSSPKVGRQVMVRLSWRFVPLGDIFERLLEQQDETLLSQLDAEALQTKLDPVIYGALPVGGNQYTLHPSLVQTAPWVTALQATQGNLAALNVPTTPPPVLNIPVTNGVGQTYGQAMTVTVYDPASQSTTVAAGANQASFTGITPGTWRIKAIVTNNPERQAESQLTVNSDGTWSVANGGLKLPPIIETVNLPLQPQVFSRLFSRWSAEADASDRLANLPGTLLNGATFAAGVLGQGFSLDGIDDCVNIGHSPHLQITNTLTLTGWFKTSATGSRQMIIQKGDATLGFEWVMEVESDGKLHAHFAIGSGGTTVFARASTAAVNDGQWHHFGATFNTAPASEDITLYLDGVLQPTISSDQRAAFNYGTNTGNISIGCRNTNSAPALFFKGNLDELSTYRTLLSAADIQADYQRRLVAVTGAGFDSTPANNQFTIAGLPAHVVKATATTLTVALPLEQFGSPNSQNQVGTLSSNLKATPIAFPQGTSAADAVKTCLSLKVDKPSATDGAYWIDPNGGSTADAFQAHCNMTQVGGGWTMVQRTVWDWLQSQALFTNYAVFQGTSVGDLLGTNTAGRLAASQWPAIQQTFEHMLKNVARQAATGASCQPQYYRNYHGAWNIPVGGGASVTNSYQTVTMFDSPNLSTTDNGPSTGCVNGNQAVPWTYTGCCTTCPTFKGGYWADDPHPMAGYMATPDIYGKTTATECGGNAPLISIGYYGLNEMAYFLR